MSAGWASFPGEKLPDHDMGPSLVIYVWTLTGISGVVVGLRLFVVSYILRRVRAADYTMVAAWLFAVVTGAMVTKSVESGLGRHIYYLTPEQVSNVIKWSVAVVGPSIICVVLARMSFCLFLLSTVGVRRVVRILLWTALSVQAVFNVSQVLVQYLSCGTHLAALWDPSVKAKCVPYDHIIKYFYFLSALNTFTDLFLTILPAVLIINLNMEFRKKVVVMILLCLSALAFIASLVKCVMTKEMKSPDPTWAVARLTYWIMAEGYVVIIVASMPMMNSLVKWGKETITQLSYGSAVHSQDHITVKQGWTVEHEKAADVESSSQDAAIWPVK